MTALAATSTPQGAVERIGGAALGAAAGGILVPGVVAYVRHPGPGTLDFSWQKIFRGWPVSASLGGVAGAAAASVLLHGLDRDHARERILQGTQYGALALGVSVAAGGLAGASRLYGSGSAGMALGMLRGGGGTASAVVPWGIALGLSDSVGRTP